MTKQEAIEILTEMRDWNDYITQSDALQMAIDALEQKPCTDAISRQAMLDGLEKYHEGADLHIDGLTYAYDLVCKLPSVSTGKLESFDKAKQEIRYGESKAYNADFTAGCEYAISVIERIFEEQVSTEKTEPCTRDKPCTECSQYDNEKHYCPHFCHVIRNVIEEVGETE